MEPFGLSSRLAAYRRRRAFDTVLADLLSPNGWLDG